MQTNAAFSVVISTQNRWRAPKLATDRSLKCPCSRLVIMTMRVFIRNIAGGDSIMYTARCIIFGVPRLPVRPCDERPPAIYGHFCRVPRVSVHDRYYCNEVRNWVQCSTKTCAQQRTTAHNCDVLKTVTMTSA